MGKYKDVTDIIKTLRETATKAGMYGPVYRKIADMIESAPAADVAPVVRAEWEVATHKNANDVEPVRRGTWLDAEESDLIGNPVDAYYCSCCKKAKTGAVRYPRCHICGAIMSNPTCFEDFVI